MAKPDSMPIMSDSINKNRVGALIGLMSIPNSGDNNSTGILKNSKPGIHLPSVSAIYCPKTLSGRKNREKAVPSQNVSDAVVWTSTCSHKIAARSVYRNTPSNWPGAALLLYEKTAFQIASSKSVRTRRMIYPLKK